MTYDEIRKELGKIMDALSEMSQEVGPSVAKELYEVHQHVHMAYIRLSEIIDGVK